MPPLDESCPTENLSPSASYEQPPTDNRPASKSSNYPFLFSNSRPQPQYSQIMPIKGYEYGCHGLFIHFQAVSKLEYHPPTDNIPFPHYTSTFNDLTPYESDKPAQKSKTAKTPTPLSTERPHQRTNTTNPPFPRSRRPVARSRPAASSTKEESERTIKYHARLALVNGISTPSNGTVTKVANPQSKGNICPICGKGHNRRQHLESHFAGCAERNGNPEGYVWNELIEYNERAGNKRGRDEGSDEEEENGGGKRARGTRR